jgi:hypothetical protein
VLALRLIAKFCQFNVSWSDWRGNVGAGKKTAMDARCRDIGKSSAH